LREFGQRCLDVSASRWSGGSIPSISAEQQDRTRSPNVASRRLPIDIDFTTATLRRNAIGTTASRISSHRWQYARDSNVSTATSTPVFRKSRMRQRSRRHQPAFARN
jgi:hypothetical protein